MPNNFDSNFQRKLVRVFLERFESKRSVSKAVNTQILEGKFDRRSGANVDFQRPRDFVSTRTSDGDISGQNAQSIIAGKATGTVQDYFTVDYELKDVDMTLKYDQLSEDEDIDSAATRMVTDLETDFAKYMVQNSNLSYGDPDTAVTTWQHVANWGALMRSVGVPTGDWSAVLNPFAVSELADQQRGMGAGGKAGNAVMSALEQATMVERFAGFRRVMSADTLYSFTTNAITDRAGTLSATPDGTYVTAKDTMTQSLAVTAFTANLTVKAGEIIEVTGRFRNSLSTRQAFVDGAGAQVKWRGTVTADVTLGASGEGTLVVSGPAIFETGGAYNTVSSALTSGDVVTLLGTGTTTYQPNLFFHKNAFAIGGVKLSKLNSTDTIMTTKDGISIRCSKYADVRGNVQGFRFDLLPAYAVLNPFFAGQGFGTS